MRLKSARRPAGVGLRVSLVAVLSLLAGCATAPPPQPKIITLKNPKLLRKYEMVPVQKAWKNPKFDLRKYDKVIVRRVETPSGIKLTELEKTNLDSTLGVYAAQLRKFASYTESAFKKAIIADPRLQLVDNAGPNTMVLQLALVKVVPGKPLLGILRNVPIPLGQASFIITPAIKIVGGAVDDLKASVSIEGELLDSETGEVIAMFADTETEKTALINLALMSSYGTPEQIVDEWAKLFVEALNRRKGQKLEKPARVKLIN